MFYKDNEQKPKEKISINKQQICKNANQAPDFLIKFMTASPTYIFWHVFNVNSVNRFGALKQKHTYKHFTHEIPRPNSH